MSFASTRGVVWTAAACCRFREASLLAVEWSKGLFRHGAFVFAAAEGVPCSSGDFDGSKVSSAKRQQAAAVHVEPERELGR